MDQSMQKNLYLSQKRKFSRYLKKLSGAGARAAIWICGSSKPESVRAERNIFGSTTLVVKKRLFGIRNN
jgi:hypothetical protein